MLILSVKHNGNLTMDQIADIARKLQHKSYAKSLEGVIKEVLGTAFSVGCTVDGMSPKDVSDKIGAGEIEVPQE